MSNLIEDIKKLRKATESRFNSFEAIDMDFVFCKVLALIQQHRVSAEKLEKLFLENCVELDYSCFKYDISFWKAIASELVVDKPAVKISKEKLHDFWEQIEVKGETPAQSNYNSMLGLLMELLDAEIIQGELVVDKPSEFCSAHKYGEDKSCKICYPDKPAMVDDSKEILLMQGAKIAKLLKDNIMLKREQPTITGEQLEDIYWRVATKPNRWEAFAAELNKGRE